ncbi:acyltransferase family protein [Erwinia rhapontici]|uniref:acyltransferase family protein n=1 Tax=Erwinia rhapontici TaxID=55212 RepID=UPI003B9E5EFE
MGHLRLMLAVCVIIDHTQLIFGRRMFGGSNAVEAFFMISGFYMAMILNEKYIGVGSYFKFISNRFLKIYPVYYVCMVLILVVSLLFWCFNNDSLRIGPYFNYFNEIPFSAKSLLIFSNLFIFGQDLVMFSGVDVHSGIFYFTNDFRTSSPQLYNLLLNPPAWSISVELMFYLIAPFIVRRDCWLISVLAMLSIFVKFYITKIIGWDYDPWTYRFFLSELSFFLLGTLAYKIVTPLVKKLAISDKCNFIYLAFLLSFIIFYEDIYFPGKIFVIFIMLFFGIPIIFEFTKKSKFDKFIGELSYPVYLIHLIINYAIVSAFSKTAVISYKGEIVVVISIVISVIIMIFVIKPIDAYRQRRLIKINS